MNLKYNNNRSHVFFRNLTYKNLMGKLWVASFCSQAELIVKTDDDA